MDEQRSRAAQEKTGTLDHEQNNFRPSMNETVFRTGRQYALDLAKRYAGTDWIALVMERSGRQRDETEWHIQEDMVPPDDIRQACESMLS